MTISEEKEEQLEELLNDMRETERRGFLPEQRQLAKKHADQLEEILKEND